MRHHTVDGQDEPEPRGRSFRPGLLWGAAIERSPLAIAMTEGDDFVVRVANAAFSRVLGIPRERLIGDPLPDALPEAPARVLRSVLARVHRSGEAAQAKEVQHIHPKDGAHFLDITVWPMVKTGARADSLSVHVLDVTDHVGARRMQHRLTEVVREANERLVVAGVREQELAERARLDAERLDALLRSMHGGVAIIDGDGRITTINQWGRDVLGLPAPDGPVEPNEIRSLDLRRPDGAVAPAEDLPFSRALRGQRFTDVELVLVRPDRTRVRLAFHGSAIRDEETGEVTNAILVFQDVTELRRLEELRSDYISLISHDLRAPLSAIVGYAELLEMHARREGKEKEVEHARRIHTAAYRMNAMIQDLVESTRMEAGALELQQTPTDPVELLVGLLERIGTEEDRARIHLDAPERLPMLVLDRERIERAITNLVTNALKYSPAAAPVTIRVRQVDGEVVVSVIDRGPGIPPNLVPRLFQRFYRAERRAESEGLGLGLYIARLIVEAHGGRIWAESEIGEGSTFIIALPIG